MVLDNNTMTKKCQEAKYVFVFYVKMYFYLTIPMIQNDSNLYL